MCEHSRSFQQLDLTSDLRLATHQNATRVKHAGSRRVMIVGVLQDKKCNLAWPLSCDSNLRLIPLARLSRQNALFCRKVTFYIPHIPYYKYPYTHEMQSFQREFCEKNPRKTYPLTKRTLLVFGQTYDVFRYFKKPRFKIKC